MTKLIFHFYFSNIHISVNNEFVNLKLGICVANISPKPTCLFHIISIIGKASYAISYVLKCRDITIESII